MADQILRTTVYTSVGNLQSESRRLEFANFTFWKVESLDQLTAARSLLGPDIMFGHWIYARTYLGNPNPGPSGLSNDFGQDAENTLLLLRLFKTGDITFGNLVIDMAGTKYNQVPYRLSATFPSTKSYRLEQPECSEWDQFAAELQGKTAWSSPWFTVARRFFLYGTSKEFGIDTDQVDRVMDYMIALEAAVVPETDFVSRRLRERAAILLDTDEAKKILKDFYEVRSTIAHGGYLGQNHWETLRTMSSLENVVRRSLVECLRLLPADETERKRRLADLYDVPESAKAEKLLADFSALKDEAVVDKLIPEIIGKAARKFQTPKFY